jgi:DNA (cytosine-5)-methyltransferase 1
MLTEECIQLHRGALRLFLVFRELFSRMCSSSVFKYLHEAKSPSPMIERAEIAAVDLFCGVGGLTRGLEKSGIDVRLGVDIDVSCEYPYERNNRATFMLGSVDEVGGSHLNRFLWGARHRLLAGCAPCQPFSTYSQKSRDSVDERWCLLRQFGRLVREMQPELVTMENVPRLAQQEIFDEFVNDLRRQDFMVFHRVVNCADYGVPQLRHRLVLLASRLGDISLIEPVRKPENYRTVRDAIGSLPTIGAGEADERDPLHQASTLSPTNMKRIRVSTPGGTWRDWDEELVATCHRRTTGKTYPSVYGRMGWDEPAPTVTTQFYGFGNGRFGHPEQHRAISLREGAILQSFPKNYGFVAPGQPIYRKTIGRLIGNAVPVKLGQAIGRSIVRHVESCG